MFDGLADHVTHVYRLALRLTRNVHRAEDLTQETFLKAWRRHSQLKEIKAVRAWLFKIAVNLMRDDMRRGQSHDAELLTIDNEPIDPQATPDRIAQAHDHLTRALAILDSLPQRQRMVLYLVAIEEFALNEVCEILDLTMTAAKANLSLARKRMREEWQKQFPNTDDFFDFDIAPEAH